MQQSETLQSMVSQQIEGTEILKGGSCCKVLKQAKEVEGDQASGIRQHSKQPSVLYSYSPFGHSRASQTQLPQQMSAAFCRIAGQPQTLSDSHTVPKQSSGYSLRGKLAQL